MQHTRACKRPAAAGDVCLAILLKDPENERILVLIVVWVTITQAITIYCVCFISAPIQAAGMTTMFGHLPEVKLSFKEDVPPMATDRSSSSSTYLYPGTWAQLPFRVVAFQFGAAPIVKAPRQFWIRTLFVKVSNGIPRGTPMTRPRTRPHCFVQCAQSPILSMTPWRPIVVHGSTCSGSGSGQHPRQWG